MKIPLSPPTWHQLLRELTKNNQDRLIEVMTMGVGPETNGQYFHWDQMRHRPPPGGLSHDEWWLATKQARLAISKRIELADPKGKHFSLALTAGLHRKLHQMDRDAGGAIKAGGPIAVITSDENRDRYLIRSLFEEAITSSQLEGASTTTSEAKKMLRSGRRPRDRSEQMILNNYRAMSFVRENRDRPLSEEFILELQRILTESAMDDPGASGRWRTDEEDIVVADNRDGTVLYRPPPANLIPARMKALIDFANSEQEDSFIHPIIQAVILHFMLSYEHPFADGNGRTARALFYWFMSRKGYWLIEFLSISKVIKQSPTNYARAFLFVETDDNDLTYFLHQQFDVIMKSITSLHKYLAEKTKEIQQTEQLLHGPVQKVLNHRQVALVSHALKNPNHLYDIQSHQTSHGVTYQTARTDLLGLEELGLLTKFKRGKAFIFQSPQDIGERINELNKELSIH
jgi:Fic family protein